MVRNLALLAIGLSLVSCSTKTKKIGIQPIGKVPINILNPIKESIENAYHIDAVILQEKPIPNETFVNIKSPRYRADKLIKWLKTNKPDSLSNILGLITKDISTTKKNHLGQIKKPESKYRDWGIFGLGYRPGPSCIVSTYRLKMSTSKANYMERLKKVSVHEVGHNMGLKHCTSGELCVMQDAAETIRTIDKVPLKLCSSCLIKVK